MDSSLKTGFMAVFAVSGSVVFLAMHAHKRLLSDFIKKIEFEIKSSSTGVVKDEPKKKVRFADDVVEISVNKAYRKNHPPTPAVGGSRNSGEDFEATPQNWQVLYKGILQHRRGITNF